MTMLWPGAALNRELIAERFLNRLGTTGERMRNNCASSATPHRGGRVHRKGAAPADKRLAVIPGSRGNSTYLVRPRAEEALCSLAHGAGRKWSRGEAKDRLVRRFSIADLVCTKLGSRAICDDRDLIFEEAPQAYKDVHQVVRNLDQAELIDPIARLLQGAARMAEIILHLSSGQGPQGREWAVAQLTARFADAVAAGLVCDPVEPAHGPVPSALLRVREQRRERSPGMFRYRLLDRHQPLSTASQTAQRVGRCAASPGGAGDARPAR